MEQIMGLKLRQMRSKDFPAVHSIIQNTGVLDSHKPYTYWVMKSISPALMIVAEQDNRILGFVGGFTPYKDNKSAFIWQIGVLPESQSRGLGSNLLAAYAREATSQGVARVLFTIAEDNSKSTALFARFAKSFGSSMEILGETGTLGGTMATEITYSVDIG